MQERRKQPRARALSRIAVISMPEMQSVSGGPTSDRSSTVDVSRAGMRFKSRHFIPINSFLRIDVSRLCSDHAVQLSGLVRWIDKVDGDHYFDVGIELLVSRDTDWWAWTKYATTRVTE